MIHSHSLVQVLEVAATKKNPIAIARKRGGGVLNIAKIYYLAKKEVKKCIRGSRLAPVALLIPVSSPTTYLEP
jgi:hypothetical protein